MLRAIIFDFDGVVADNEPIHFAMFRQVLAEIGLPLTEADYCAKYLGCDDKGCFAAVLAEHGRPVTPGTVQDLVARKAQAYLAYIRNHLVIFPGVTEFVQEAAARYPVAIASGALRHEIEFILEQAGLRKEFAHITSSEDVQHGKPDPEGYRHALAALNAMRPARDPAIQPADCLVIEDSLPGIEAAHAAGMKVLAVANTHDAEELQEAEVVTRSLADVRLNDLRRRLWQEAS